MNKTLLIVIAALATGYLIGNSGKDSNKSSSTYNTPYSISNTSLDHEEELNEKIENARANLENALANAEELEHQATMRWIQTGNINDMIRMHDAEDAVQAIQDGIDDLDN